MRSNFRKRLDELETETDWVADLDIVDYIGLTDYDDGTWVEVHHDQTITVLRNKNSGEVRGVYNDRRTDEELLAMGGDLAYL